MIPVAKCIFSLFGFILVAAQGVKDDSKFAVIAYLPEWRYEGANFDTICQHVTHLIFFSIEPSGISGDFTGLDRLPGEHVLKAARLAATRNRCKLLICFGGNGIFMIIVV